MRSAWSGQTCREPLAVRVGHLWPCGELAAGKVSAGSSTVTGDLRGSMGTHLMRVSHDHAVVPCEAVTARTCPLRRWPGARARGEQEPEPGPAPGPSCATRALTQTRAAVTATAGC